MQPFITPESHNTAVDKKMDSSSRLKREWEEISRLSRPRNSSKQSSAHGDANQWIIELNNPETRLQAMHNLYRNHKNMPDLGILLWHSFGAVSSLIQEILVAFSRKDIERAEAVRVVCALALMETIAEHPRTRVEFICSNLHEFVAPLATQGPTTHFQECCRRAAMRVMYALVSTEHQVRGVLTEKEYKCILAQLTTEGFFAEILNSVTKYGSVVAQLLAVQMLSKVASVPEILTLYLQDGDNFRVTVESLEHLNTIFVTKAPTMCIGLKKLYEAVHINFHSYQQTEAPIAWKSNYTRQG